MFTTTALKLYPKKGNGSKVYKTNSGKRVQRFKDTSQIIGLRAIDFGFITCFGKEQGDYCQVTGAIFVTVLVLFTLFHYLHYSIHIIIWFADKILCAALYTSFLPLRRKNGWDFQLLLGFSYVARVYIV